MSRRTGAWRARASFAEGATNLRESGVLGAVLVGLAAVLVAAGLLVDVRAAHAVVEAESGYLAAGGDLLVAQAGDDGSIDAARCVAVAGTTGVRASAAVTVAPGAAGIVGRPAAEQTVVTATDGVLDVLDLPAPRPDGVVVAAGLADRWEWAAGSHLQLVPRESTAGLPTGVLTVEAVADLARLSEGASTGVLVLAAPIGDAQACFVRIDPQYRDDLRAALPAVLGETAAGPVSVSDRLPAGALAQDPASAYDHRVTRWVGGAVGAVVGLVWAVVAWTRRGRAALYASLGVPWAGGVLVRWVEGLGIALLGTVWGTSLAATTAVTALGVPAPLAVDLAVRGGALAFAVASLVVVAAGLWQPPTLASLKDR
ncbi:hypothetical protein [Cellulomonas sp. SLBN-39]|uniref:hypothetical protein n=1 Tax=Cellulomonas sp. SLBN-39 TaxID=2768446 RepID=UPI001154C162|nr:hypothetical protein [Cellulomonas sp. SLBN-39]TQL02504.1 hypothetical protein FBY24_1581 [Cellulomonas sp. SLBN-39]